MALAMGNEWHFWGEELRFGSLADPDPDMTLQAGDLAS